MAANSLQEGMTHYLNTLSFPGWLLLSCLQLHKYISIIQMNVKKAMDKLTEWNNAGEKLKQHVPNNDEVLHSWQTQLEEFSQDLPLLRQLSSDALKVINPCRTVCTKRFWFQSQIQVLWGY